MLPQILLKVGSINTYYSDNIKLIFKAFASKNKETPPPKKTK